MIMKEPGTAVGTRQIKTWGRATGEGGKQLGRKSSTEGDGQVRGENAEAYMAKCEGIHLRARCGRHFVVCVSCMEGRRQLLGSQLLHDKHLPRTNLTNMGPALAFSGVFPLHVLFLFLHDLYPRLRLCNSSLYTHF